MGKGKSSAAYAGACRDCGRRVAALTLANCPACGGVVAPLPSESTKTNLGWFSLPPMRYQAAYVWFVLVSALDLMLTLFILELGGSEVNLIADAVLGHRGINGLVAFKFALVVFVLVMCEQIGRRNDAAGRKLSEWAVAITAIPVALSLAQLAAEMINIS